MLIDVHAHILPPAYLDALTRSGRYEVEEDSEHGIVVKEKGSRFLTIPPQLPDIEQRIADMDQSGIDMQVLSVSTPQVYFLSGDEVVELARRCNDYLASVVESYPNRFRALASIPLTANSVDDAVRELARCVTELGMPGFIIGGTIDGTPIDDERFDPFYEEANRLGATMFIHPRVPAGVEAMDQSALTPRVGFMLDTTLAVSRLIFSNFFGRFLGINVIVAHLGGALPFLAGRLDAGYRKYPELQGTTRAPGDVLRDIYFDSVAFHEPAIRCAIDTVGVERILFGTDYPHLSGNMTQAIDLLEEMKLSRGEKRSILGNNAAGLFGLEVESGSTIPFLNILGG